MKKSRDSKARAGETPMREPAGSAWPLMLLRLEDVPDIRWEKVVELRRKLASGTWDPETEKVAEKIICEHLLCRSGLAQPPAPSPQKSPEPGG